MGQDGTRTLLGALQSSDQVAIFDDKSGQAIPASKLRSLVLSTADSLRASGVGRETASHLLMQTR